jgi:hypothetical protein
MNAYQTLGKESLLEKLDEVYGEGVVSKADAEDALYEWKLQFSKKFHGRYENGGLLVASYSSESFLHQVKRRCTRTVDGGLCPICYHHCRL